MKKRKKTLTGNMLRLGVGNLVGVGLIGATASAVNQLPSGTAKDVASVVPGLQSLALVSHNLPKKKSKIW